MIPYTSVRYDSHGHRAYFSWGGGRVARWLGPYRQTLAEANEDRVGFDATNRQVGTKAALKQRKDGEA